MTTDRVFILFKNTDFNTILACLKAVAIKLIKFRHFCVYCKIQTS